jgi:hypothetical protein
MEHGLDSKRGEVVPEQRYIVPQRTLDKIVEFLQEQAPVKLLSILQNTITKYDEPVKEKETDG